jgi:DNA-binding NarL/FixJ family response regulator
MPWRVVVVDDDPQFRALESALLTNEGDFEIVGEAADSAEASRVVEKSRPDVVLLDLDMGVEGAHDGLGVVVDLRHDHPQLEVVMVSGFGTSDYYSRSARDAGAAGLLPKDSTLPDRLAPFLRSLLNKFNQAPDG